MALIRLQKFIADCGITSRRKAEDLIVQGRVKINGEVVKELGTKVDTGTDAVAVDGEYLSFDKVQKMYLVMNKPRGVMTTLSDPEGRRTVIDLCKEVTERIYPVGRLDYLSEGLLILTNDGDFANDVIHPSKNVVKVYEVKVFGAVDEALLKKLRAGVQSSEGFLKPRSVRVIKQLPTKTWLEFRLDEGKNREIRRMCESFGITIDKLKRVAIGGMSVEGISPGSYRFLNKKQIVNMIGLDREGDEPIEVWSGKKTVNLKKKGVQNYSLATDEGFQKLRKGSYYSTLKEAKEKKEKAIQEKKLAQFTEREEAHQKRVNKKKRRVENKKQNEKGVHAMFVK